MQVYKPLCVAEHDASIMHQHYTMLLAKGDDLIIATARLTPHLLNTQDDNILKDIPGNRRRRDEDSDIDTIINIIERGDYLQAADNTTRRIDRDHLESCL